MPGKIGRFMLGAGGIIEYKETGEILILKRDKTDFNSGFWEIPYGRIGQFEEIETALRRELLEETSTSGFKIIKLLRLWHIFRGTEKTAENEIHGYSFWMRTESKQIELSPEHSEYRWVKAEEALKIVTLPGILKDIDLFIKHKQDPTLPPEIHTLGPA